MFSKRHYEFLANWLDTASLALYSNTDRVLVAHSLADHLERDNARFNRDRFLRACGVIPEGATVIKGAADRRYEKAVKVERHPNFPVLQVRLRTQEQKA